MSDRNVTASLVHALSAFAVGACSAALANAELPAALKELQEFYRQTDSVKIVATVEFDIREPLFKGHSAPLVGTGSFEHQESSAMFRTRASADPRLHILEGFDIAFDGNDYQLYNSAANTLALQDPKFGDGQLLPVPTPMPNPFYLPVAFLAPDEDKCPGCQMTLEFVRQSPKWQSAEAEMRTLGNSDGVLKLNGGSRDGEQYEFAVRLRTQLATHVANDGPGGPAHEEVGVIERCRLDGAVVSDITFSDYRPIAGTKSLFPRRIVIRDLNPDAKPAERLLSAIDYLIQSVEINPKIDESEFVIKPRSDTAIWNRGVLQGARPMQGSSEP